MFWANVVPENRPRFLTLALLLFGLAGVCFSAPTSAQTDEPDYIKALGNLGTEIRAESELRKSQSELLINAIEAQSGPEYFWDTIKSFTPGYAEYKLRGNVPGIGFFSGGLLGENLKQQAIELNSEPLVSFAADYARIAQYLMGSDLRVALEFESAVQGLSQSEELSLDFWSLFQFAGISILLIVGVPRYGPRTKSCSKATIERINPIGLAICAAAALVIGFFLSNNYNPYWGILGSIQTMDIAVAGIQVPYRWVVIIALAALFFALWLMLRSPRGVEAKK